MANSVQPLRRLAGLETEYAIRMPASAASPRSHYELYESLIPALRQRIPLADAALDKMGHFLANGGAIWFEMVRLTGEYGLIEGSTPECRGPRQLLAYQRAQDRLFSEAAAGSQSGPFTLLKNCRDSIGNYYGAQENYEFPIASGLRLACWRIGLALLAPLIPLTWMGLLARVLIYIALLLVYIVVSHLAFLLVIPFVRDRATIRRWLIDGILTSQGSPIEGWMETGLNFLALAICTPLALSMYLLLRLTAFVDVRKELTAFLVSRSVIAGAGTLDDGGHFQIAEKASGLNCLTGLGGFIDDRPVYTFGHFLKAALSEVWNLHRRYLRLFRRRQRLQIGLGDSNMAQTAEFLRIGTTMLLLDMLEDGALCDAPRLRNPLMALHTIAADPSLKAAVEMCDGSRCTALELQRWYLAAARRWLAEKPWHEEAHEVIELWEQTLDQLEHDREQAVGRIDWVTKLYLLSQAGTDASAAARKKIDLKYHQLGPDGYYAQLEAAGACALLATAAEIDRASRVPPSGSPASARGRFIREFAGESMAVNWDFVLLRRRFRTEVIDLDHYFRQQPREEAAPK